MPSYDVRDMAQGGSGISDVPRSRVFTQGQLRLLTSTAQCYLLPQAETPTVDPELAEFTYRRLLRTAPASLFTLLNTSGWPLQADLCPQGYGPCPTVA